MRASTQRCQLSAGNQSYDPYFTRRAAHPKHAVSSLEEAGLARLTGLSAQDRTSAHDGRGESHNTLSLWQFKVWSVGPAPALVLIHTNEER